MQATLVFTTKAKSLVAIQLWLASRQVSLCSSSTSQRGHELWALDQLENLQVAQHLQFSHLHPPADQQWMITALLALVLSSAFPNFSCSAHWLINLFWKGRFAGHFGHHFYARQGQKQVSATCGSQSCTNTSQTSSLPYHKHQAGPDQARNHWSTKQFGNACYKVQ